MEPISQTPVVTASMAQAPSSAEPVGPEPRARRPIRARDSAWAAAVAGGRVGGGVIPMAFSRASIVCAAIAGGALLGTQFVEPPLAQCALFILAIAGIQARLLCN